MLVLRTGVISLLWAGTWAGLVAPVWSQVTRPDDPINLDPIHITTQSDDDGYDPTGMGAQEAELREPPFSNDLLTGAGEESEAVGELNIELGMIATASPADLVAGLNRLNLRGFPTPRLRNGFIQLGVPEILNAGGGERIQGPLTPVTGKAAPGGIDNVSTARPRAATQRRFSVSTVSARENSGSFELNSPIVPKKAWQRWAMTWRNKKGPEAYSVNRYQTLSGAVTIKHSRAASTLFQVDYSDTDANPGSGIPEYRLTRTSPVIGPFLPLAYLHINGPDGRIRKKVASVSAQFEAQLNKAVSLRAGVQWFWRSLVEDRFTKGEYLLDERVFAGTREPQHQEQPLEAINGGVEVTTRFAAFGADHKVLVSLERSTVDYTREQRGLDTAERNAQPLSVRRFDPYYPDYFRTPFGVDSYRRIIADRTEETTYTAISVTERVALDRGKTVLTAGVRHDLVELDIADRRPGVAKPTLADTTSQITWLAGANHQLYPGKVLLFANTSTAFEPSTRVDARTSRIQGNETTHGFEAGLKTLGLERRLSTTLLGFWYINDNISRRNPLYDDPIADANQTQPQLVAAGGERFTGGSLDVRFNLNEQWMFTGRATYTNAITTASPDIPEEVGRPLTRLPAETLALGARYVVPDGRWKGLSLSGNLTYVGDFVAYYADRNRAYLDYPSYTLVGANVTYGWARKKTLRHSVGLGVRNLFDVDLLERLARPGQSRALTASYGATF
ncbi:MAG: TonB-dependent receptor [Opitutaceae bacterium]